MASQRNDEEKVAGSSRRAPSARVLALRAELLYLRHELQALLDGLDAVNDVAPSSSAVVTAVVPKTVLMHQSLRRE